MFFLHSHAFTNESTVERLPKGVAIVVIKAFHFFTYFAKPIAYCEKQTVDKSSPIFVPSHVLKQA